jgi:hypothetical protein
MVNVLDFQEWKRLQQRVDRLSNEIRYDLLTSEQASPSEMADWLKDAAFKEYVFSRHN